MHIYALTGMIAFAFPFSAAEGCCTFVDCLPFATSLDAAAAPMVGVLFAFAFFAGCTVVPSLARFCFSACQWLDG